MLKTNYENTTWKQVIKNVSQTEMCIFENFKKYMQICLLIESQCTLKFKWTTYSLVEILQYFFKQIYS